MKSNRDKGKIGLERLRLEIRNERRGAIAVAVIAAVAIVGTRMAFRSYSVLSTTGMGGLLEPSICVVLLVISLIAITIAIERTSENAFLQKRPHAIREMLQKRMDRAIVLGVCGLVVAQLVLWVYPILIGIGFPNLPVSPSIMAILITVYAFHFIRSVEPKAAEMLASLGVSFEPKECPVCQYPTAVLPELGNDSHIARCPECGALAWQVALPDPQVPFTTPGYESRRAVLIDASVRNERLYKSVEAWFLFAALFFHLSMATLFGASALGLISVPTMLSKLNGYYLLYGAFAYLSLSLFRAVVGRHGYRIKQKEHQLVLAEYAARAESKKS